ncbi:MAG: type II toxin-antitoxin system RatA family toxin [Rickettsiales bacterium]|nr:type II toxin-antitoxin system RatA family toxin [Rickettsiales bacterium]
MPSHTERQFMPYPVPALFALVADIEHYPEFLPWCRAARILERKEGEFLGELVISFHHLTESYTSRVVLTPQSSPDTGAAIDVTMVKGPFEYLTNHWRFTPVEGGTQIDFALDFKFRSRILEKLIGGLFGKATSRMVTAFKDRADSLNGAAHG